ncbi:MAG: hypothetical protein J0L73_24875 [Verrucomicrobia bacterium]|nr:hypothetical protein [Verrucomicrobiota bacterium]
MKLLPALLCTLTLLSLPGHAETPPVHNDATQSAVEAATKAARKDLALKEVELSAAAKEKADADKASSDKAGNLKELKELMDKTSDPTARATAQTNYNTAAAQLLELQKKAEEKNKAWNAALEAKLAAEASLAGRQGGGGGASGPAAQNPLTLDNETIYQASLEALTKLFVVAVLLESGLALLFNWPIFLTTLNRRTWRPVIMFIAALILVWGFDLDIMAQLIAIYNSSPAKDATVTGFPALVSTLISASVLAGGSAGVFNIMAAMGFRSAHERDSAPTPPGAEHAWVSIRLTGFGGTQENVKVNIEQTADAGQNPPAATAGTITPGGPNWRDQLRPLKNRFPPVAGYTVEAGKFYKIQVMVKTPVTAENPRGEKDLLKDRGIYKFAPRAIVDLVVPYTAG